MTSVRSNQPLIALLATAAVVTAGACNRTPKVDEMPIGADVQLTREDGALVEGTLEGRDDRVVRIDAGRVTRTVARDEIAEVRVRDEANPEAVPKTAKFREVAVPATTNLQLRLEDGLSSLASRVEQPIRATLAAPVVVDGVTVLPAGAAVRGVVSSATASGKVKGRASVGAHFTALSAAGETYTIDARLSRVAEATKTSDAKKIGIPAAGGAVVGAIIGGKKGAAIGAAAGGGAGTAVVLSTPGREVVIPAGTTVTLDIGRALDVRVPID